MIVDGYAAPLIAWHAALSVTATVFIGLRFVAARRRNGPRGHDWVVFVSYVFMVGYVVDTAIGTVHGGVGVHVTEVSGSRLTVALKTFWSSEILWAASVTTVRIGMMWLWADIFSTPRYRSLSRGVTVLAVLFGVGTFLMVLLSCRPIETTWDTSIPGACGDIAGAELASAMLNLSVDVVEILIQAVPIWALQLSWEKKARITAIFVFGLGIIAVIDGVRVYEVKSCSISDFTHCMYANAILAEGEMAMGIIAATVPALGVLWKRSPPPVSGTGSSANVSRSSILCEKDVELGHV